MYTSTLTTESSYSSILDLSYADLSEPGGRIAQNMAPFNFATLSPSSKAWLANWINLGNGTRYTEHLSAGTTNSGYRQLKLTAGSPGYDLMKSYVRTEPGAPPPDTQWATLTTLKYTFDAINTTPLSTTQCPLYIALHGGGGPGTPDLNTAEAWAKKFSEAKASNDSAWRDMSTYYKGAISSSLTAANRSGIYVALRGVGDSPDMHCTPAGIELIQRLIENMILFENVNSNRVYLLGFSAGGDGVYALSAQLANRFAAVNMSAGHSNGVSLQNLINLPICLQVGEQDTGTTPPSAYDRSMDTANKGKELDGYASQFTNPTTPVYVHDVFLHLTPSPERPDPPKNTEPLTIYYYRHNSWEDGAWLARSDRPKSTVIKDYVDWRNKYKFDPNANPKVDEPTLGLPTTTINTNAIDWVSEHSRTPLPANIVWNLNVRPNPPDATVALSERSRNPAMLRKGQYYWLDIGARSKADLGDIDVIQATMAKNLITVKSAKNYLRILLRQDTNMPDLSSPVRVVIGSQTLEVKVPSDENSTVINQTMALNDPSFVFSADIILHQASNGTWSASTTPHPQVKSLM